VYATSLHEGVVASTWWHAPPECVGSSFLALLSDEASMYARPGSDGKTWSIRYWDPALEPNITTEELLEGLSSLGPLDELKLDHVVLSTPMAQDDQEEWFIAPRRLTLSHIDARSLVALFEIVDRGLHRFPSLTLINCALCTVPSVLSTQLTLQNIRPQFDLVGFLRCWDGEILQIKDCPGFTLQTLKLFTTLGGQSHSGAPSLRRLVIEGCPTVTKEGLKEFITLRKNIDDVRVWEISKTPLAITSLEVVSDQPLEEEDLEWFAEEAQNICWKSPGQVQRLCGWLRREPLSDLTVSCATVEEPLLNPGYSLDYRSPCPILARASMTRCWVSISIFVNATMWRPYIRTKVYQRLWKKKRLLLFPINFSANRSSTSIRTPSWWVFYACCHSCLTEPYEQYGTEMDVEESDIPSSNNVLLSPLTEEEILRLFQNVSLVL